MKRLILYIKILLRKYSSPVFLMLLFSSFILWYVTKLSYTYTTEMPVRVSINGEEFDVPCVVEGAGYRLFAHRYYVSNRVVLRPTDVEMRPSDSVGFAVITPASLQNAISVRKADIKIVSVGAIPLVPVERK